MVIKMVYIYNTSEFQILHFCVPEYPQKLNTAGIKQLLYWNLPAIHQSVIMPERDVAPW